MPGGFRSQGQWPAIALRFALVYLVLAGLLTAVAALGNHFDERSRVRVMSARHEGDLQAAGKVLEHELALEASDVRYLARLPAMQAYLDRGGAQLRDQLTQDLLVFARETRRYGQVRMLDLAGQEVIRINWNDGAPGIVAPQGLQNKGSRYYFRDSIVLGPGQVYVSPLDLNVERDQVEIPHKPVLRIATPAFDGQGRKRGVVILNYLAAPLLQRFRDTQPAHEQSLMLLNREGYWLSGARRDDEWGFMLGHPERSFARDFPEEWRAIAASDSGTLRTARGLFLHRTLQPLPEELHTSTGAADPRGSSARALRPDQYQWKIVSRIPPEALAALASLSGEVRLLLGATYGLLAVGAWLIAVISVGRSQAQALLQTASLVVERSPAVLFRWAASPGWPVTYVSQNVRQWGYEPQDLLDGRVKYADLIHPDDLRRIESGVAAFAAGTADRMAEECRIVRRSGEAIWVRHDAVVERDAAGKALFFHGVVTDVDERRRAQDAALEAKSFSDQLILSQPGTFALIEPGGRYLRWNAHLQALIGISDAEMAQASALDVFEPSDRPSVEEKLREALRDGFSRYETRVVVRGLFAFYRFMAARVDTPHGSRLIVIGTDITRRKQVEESLQRANLELRALGERNQIAAAVIGSAMEGVMVMDAQLRIESVNPAFERITGYSAAKVIGQTPRILFSGKHDEAFFHRLHETVDADGRWHGEIWNRRLDGTLYPQDSSFTVLRDADGHISHYAAVFSDDTVRRELEERLRELSSTDGLTGIANRRTFDRVLAREWARAMRDGQPLSLLLMDIDYFKKYNDRYGHPEGDRCLQQVAQAIRRAANRTSDVAARYGGEEFAVILPGADAAAAMAMGERVRAAVATLEIPHAGSDAAAFVTVSIGAATVTPPQGSQPSDLVGTADGALYGAKKEGRNRVVAAADPVLS